MKSTFGVFVVVLLSILAFAPVLAADETTVTVVVTVKVTIEVGDVLLLTDDTMVVVRGIGSGVLCTDVLGTTQGAGNHRHIKFNEVRKVYREVKK